MRVNSRVFDEKTDMLGGIQIPTCPPQFKSVAERLVMMASKPGYSVSNYNNISQLDKMLMVDFWTEYDGLGEADEGFGEWFLSSATLPDILSRAIRWLISHNYLIIKPEVQERAMKASSQWRQTVSR